MKTYGITDHHEWPAGTRVTVASEFLDICVAPLRDFLQGNEGVIESVSIQHDPAQKWDDTFGDMAVVKFRGEVKTYTHGTPNGTWGVPFAHLRRVEA